MWRVRRVPGEVIAEGLGTPGPGPPPRVPTSPLSLYPSAPETALAASTKKTFQRPMDFSQKIYLLLLSVHLEHLPESLRNV